MEVYFKNKLGVTSTVALEKNNTIEEFNNKIQDNGGIEKLRVNMITSSCDCGTIVTDFLLHDIDKEIALVNVIEPDYSLSHINILHEEVRFKNIQSKVFAEVKKGIGILLQYKSNFLENNGLSLTNSKTHQGLMDRIAILKGELEEKNRQISALLNIISFKNQTETHHVLYKIPYLHGNLTKYQNTLQALQAAHHRRFVILTHLKRTFFKQITLTKKCPKIV